MSHLKLLFFVDFLITFLDNCSLGKQFISVSTKPQALTYNVVFPAKKGSFVHSFRFLLSKYLYTSRQKPPFWVAFVYFGTVLFSQGYNPSIVTAARLNFCVRDGNRCFPSAMGTDAGFCMR